jgi:PAS domain S-box-containing protein
MEVTELETDRCLDINDAFLEIFGFRRDEVIGQTTLMLGIWPDPQDRARLIERLKAELSVRNLEMSMRTKQGNLRHFLISTDLVMLGKRRCLVTVGHDITERKQAESALRESEERFRTLVSNIPGAVFRCAVDEHWTTAYVSEAIEEIVGYPAAQFMDRTRSYTRVIHPDDRSHADETVRKALRERRPYVIEYRVIHADGAIHWVSEKGQGVFEPNGDVRFLDGAIFDITKRKRDEETLRGAHEELERRVHERTGELERANAALTDSEERFRTFLDHAPNLAFIKSVDGRYLFANRRFVEALSLDQNGIAGKTDAELFPREQADEFRANDRTALEAGRAMEFEETSLYADGLRTTIAVKFPMRDRLGRIYAMGGIVTDIHERKRMEEKLLQHQEELIQHRLKLENLTMKLLRAQEEERQRISRELHDDFSQRMAVLVLDMASLEQRPPLLPELISQALTPVREGLEQLSDDLHRLAYNLHPSLLQHAGLQPAIEDHILSVIERTGLRIIFKAKDVPSTISIDWSTCLFRVLQESFQNVAKHAKATDVLVKLSGSSKGVGLSVRDNGKGFDLGERSAHQRGLGLISMQERLRLLNGLFRIHSRPANGTKVCAWIPFTKDELRCVPVS